MCIFDVFFVFLQIMRMTAPILRQKGSGDVSPDPIFAHNMRYASVSGSAASVPSMIQNSGATVSTEMPVTIVSA